MGDDGNLLETHPKCFRPPDLFYLLCLPPWLYDRDKLSRFSANSPNYSFELTVDGFVSGL